jgi:hypothetical protein
MGKRPLGAGQKGSIPPAGSTSAKRLLGEFVASVAPKPTDASLLRAAAIRAWSQVCGLVMLMLDGEAVRLAPLNPIFTGNALSLDRHSIGESL